MYGINLLKIAHILAVPTIETVLFGKDGVVKAIHQTIIRSCRENDIDMVKVMMRSLAQQDEKAYEQLVELLRKNFDEKEIETILGT